MDLEQEKERLKKAAQKLVDLTRLRSSHRLEEQAQNIIRKIDDFTFNLVVVGEFKRGKSTLINALLGEAVLPAAVTPLTSLPTVLRYGASPSIYIEFLNNREAVEEKLEKLAEFVTEKENPNNERGVKSVTVSYPNELLKMGMRIVDTPGTGSIYAHNTQATHDFLPESDAAIFVFTADQPASEAELELIEHARKFSFHQFFVLNKIDHLEEEDKQTCVDFLKSTLEKRLSATIEVFALSAKKGLASKLKRDERADSNFLRFEKSLIQFALSEKGEVFVASVESKIAAIIQELRQLIALEERNSQLSIDKLQEHLNAFNSATGKITRNQADAEFIVSGEIRKLVRQVESDLKPIAGNSASALKQDIASKFKDEAKSNKAHLIDTLREYLKLRISNIFSDWKAKEDHQIEEQFSALNSRFAEKGNEIIQEIRRITTELFGMEVTTSFEVEPLSTKSSHYYAVDSPFTLSLETLPLSLPDVISKRIIENKFLDAVEHELQRNSGRLRADYQERLERSGKKFLTMFNGKVDSALREIQDTFARAIKAKSKLEQEKERVETTITRQKSILDEITAML